MNEVVGKKGNYAAVIISCGAVLIVACAVGLTASLLNEWDPEFLWTCITSGALGIPVIALGISTARIPKDLIVATETGFVLAMINLQIPYETVRRLRRHLMTEKLFS